MRRTYVPKVLQLAYNFKGFRISQYFVTEKELRLFLEKTCKTGICPCCDVHCKNIESSYERTIRDLDYVGRFANITFIEYKIVCKCGYRGMERLDLVDKYGFYTRRFEDQVAIFCEKMTIKDASILCRINWKTTKSIDKKYLKKLIVPLSKVNPLKIGIDEVAYQKGHNYLTIVHDLELQKVIWIGISRKKETLDSFFVELGREKASKISAVVMDMWDPYIASVKEHCLNADIVF